MPAATYDDILARMQEKYRALTGTDPDTASDIGIRLRVLAGAAAELYEEVTALRRDVFPQTATGTALENHAACRGLSRKAATPSAGTLRFTREIPAGADIPIPEGIVCATRPDPQVRFATTRAGILRAGSTAVDIPAQALDAGTQGNIAVGAVRLMVTAAPGITGVTNPGPFVDGSDGETDEALRARLLGAYREISNGANAAFYYDIAMQYDQVLSAQVLPRRRGRGTVDVAIHCRTTADTNTVLPLLRAELRRRREVGVDVQVYSALKRDLDLRAEIATATGHDPIVVGAACSRALEAYIGGIGVGKSVLLAHLIRELLAVEGVHNARITAPTADLRCEGGDIFVLRTMNIAEMAG